MSGQVINLKNESLELIKQAVECYKAIRQFISKADPIWPLGLSDFKSNNAVFGLKCGKTIFLAIWQFKGNTALKIPLSNYGLIVAVTLYFPVEFPCKMVHDGKEITINLSKQSARLLKISMK